MRKVVILFILVILLSSCSRDAVEEYEVIFETNGGNNIVSIQVEDGVFILEPEMPAKEGYTFLGWFSNSELNDSFDFSTPISGDLMLYSKWEINNYSITVLDYDGEVLY